MAAFQTGFQVGSQIARDALDRKEREERAKREEEDRKQQQELRALQIQGIKDQREREQRSMDLTNQAVDVLLPGMSGVTPAASAAPQPPRPTAAALASFGVGDARPAAQPAMTPVPSVPSVPAQVSAGMEPVTAAPAATYSPEVRSLALRIQAAAQAGKDVGSMLGELRTLRDTEFERDAFAKAKDMSPEERRALIGRVNRGSRLLTAKADKNGFTRLEIISPDGDGADVVSKRLSDADLYKAAVAEQLMSRNPQRALQLLGEVDQRLAAAVAAENNLTSLLATNANDVASKSVAADASRASADASRSAVEERTQTRADTKALRTAMGELERATQSGDAAAIRAARIKVREAGGTLEKPDDRLAQDVRAAFQAAIKPDQFGRSPEPTTVEAVMASGYGANWRDIMMGRGVSGAATAAPGAQGGSAAARPRLSLESVTMADIQATADRNKQPIAKVIENVAQSMGVTADQLRAQLRGGAPKQEPAKAPARKPPTPQELADDFGAIGAPPKIIRRPISQGLSDDFATIP